MKTKVFSWVVATCLSVAGFQQMSAQSTETRLIENGGTGQFKAEVVSDASCPGFTIYRPQNLSEVVAKNGKLPVIVYANGGCVNNNLEIRYFLNEVASHGYVAAAIGALDNDDFIDHWKMILNFMYPTGKKVVLANGETVSEPKERAENPFAQVAQAAQAVQGNDDGESNVATTQFALATYPRMLLEVLDWLTDQNANPQSEYYHCLDLDEVAAMGQSCGGAQALSVAHDPRIKTCVILNSGIGDMEMAGATKEQLANLHTPMFYLIGGETDVAYPNAQKDFERIDQMPIVMINTKDGHIGTYYEKSGGSYAVATIKWLDWQLKHQVGQSALFLDDEYAKKMFPDWTVVRKNF